MLNKVILTFCHIIVIHTNSFVYKLFVDFDVQTAAKGQLLSTGHFGVFNSSKKWTWKL